MNERILMVTQDTRYSDDRVKTAFSKYDHRQFGDTTWLVKTNQNPTEFYNQIKDTLPTCIVVQLDKTTIQNAWIPVDLETFLSRVRAA